MTALPRTSPASSTTRRLAPATISARESTFANYLNEGPRLIDGRYARSLADARMMVGPATIRAMYGAVIGTLEQVSCR